MSRYWDASAVVPLCVAQAGSPVALATLADDDVIVTSWLWIVECFSAFARLRREGVLTNLQEDRARTVAEGLLATDGLEMEPSREVVALAGQLLKRHPLRASDAVHLASALIWADGDPTGFEFVCFDRRLRDAATTEGFAVLPAETDLL